MLYIQDALEEDGNATPFGPNTQALVDTDFGGIVAYISPDYLERMKEYINAPREFLVQGEPLDKDEQMVFDDND